MVGSTGKVVCAWAVFSMLWAGAQAVAQNAVLNEMYGNGAHAFFAGDYQRAYDELSAAVGGASKDPRVYYFRGFALSRLGRESEAAADFKTGAALESADINQFYPVGKSLERVQGASRLMLERERSVARATAYQRQQQRNTVRYEQFKRAESAVLRAPAGGATDAEAEEPMAKARPAAPKAPAAAADDPFAENAPPDPAEMPAEEKADDPFGEPAAPEKSGKSAKPAAEEEDPFGASKDGDAAMPEADAPAKDDAMEDSPPPKPAAKKAAAKKPAAKAAAEEEDPFGAAADAMADEPAPKKASKAAKAADDDDPFGAADDAMAAPPTAKKAAPAKKAAAAADDPFMDDADPPAKAAPKKAAPAKAKAAAPAMEDDPFGK